MLKDLKSRLARALREPATRRTDSYTDSGAGYVDGDGPSAVVYLASSLKFPITCAGAPNTLRHAETYFYFHDGHPSTTMR